MSVAAQRMMTVRSWFNGAGHNPTEALSGIAINSYDPEDAVLFTAMRAGDYGLRGGQHIDRTGAVQANGRSPLNLSHIPTLISPSAVVGSGDSMLNYSYLDLNLAVGAAENPIADVNVDARPYGWRPEKHSDLKDGEYPTMYPWFQEVFNDSGGAVIGEE